MSVLIHCLSGHETGGPEWGTYQQSDTIAFDILCHTDSVSRHPLLRDNVTLFHENNRSNCSNFSRHSSKSYNPNQCPSVDRHSIDQDRYPPLFVIRGHIQEQLSPQKNNMKNTEDFKAAYIPLLVTSRVVSFLIIRVAVITLFQNLLRSNCKGSLHQKHPRLSKHFWCR